MSEVPSSSEKVETGPAEHDQRSLAEMKPRKVKDISAPLRKKGFVEKSSGHHAQYYLHVDGKKTHIKTYLSHGAGSMEYGASLMKAVKNQLCFKVDEDAERFLDCPMKADEYIELLRKQGDL